jgi:hypothetical protein
MDDLRSLNGLCFPGLAVARSASNADRVSCYTEDQEATDHSDDLACRHQTFLQPLILDVTTNKITSTEEDACGYAGKSTNKGCFKYLQDQEVPDSFAIANFLLAQVITTNPCTSLKPAIQEALERACRKLEDDADDAT